MISRMGVDSREPVVQATARHPHQRYGAGSVKFAVTADVPTTTDCVASGSRGDHAVTRYVPARTFGMM
jgi:hypothetical protein